jgi:MoaA/NifB/PqqE/SkfB family radical SAM enzyme
MKIKIVRAAARLNLLKYGDSTMFQQVLLEINTNCNRGCWYCPQREKADIPATEMDFGTLSALLHQLNQAGWLGGIAYHYMSEPLLHSDIVTVVRITQSIVPNCWPIIHTNGDHLTLPLAQSLIAAGIYRIHVSRHPPFSADWDIRISTIMGQFHQVTLAEVTLPRNIGGRIRKLDNLAINDHCVAPMHALPIRYNGDVTVCGCDYDRTATVGNILHHDIMDIWRSFQDTRERLLRGENVFSMCEGCTKVPFNP